MQEMTKCQQLQQHQRASMWPIMCKYDVINKTRSRHYITTLLEDDEAMAIANTHKMFAVDW